MAFENDALMATGEPNDLACVRAGGNGSTVFQNTASTGMTQTGDFGLKLVMTSAGFNAFLQGETLGVAGELNHVVVGGAFAVSTTPTAALSLVMASAAANPLSTDPEFVQIGTDRKLRFFDRDGTQIGSHVSTTLIPIEDGGGTGQEVHIVFDGLTTPNMWIKVYFDKVEELAFDTGIAADAFWPNFANVAIYVGERTDGAKGCNLNCDNVLIRRSTTASDAVHLVRYPRFRGVGAAQTPPAAQGDENDWTAAGGGNHWDELDDTELPDHDSDTSYIESSTAVHKELFHSTATNPVPQTSGIKILKVQQEIVHRITSATKVGHDMLYKFGGTESTETITTPGQTYEATAVNVDKPGGGDWAKEDSELTAGESKLQFGVKMKAAGDLGSRVTYLPAPEWVYYDDTDSDKLEFGTVPLAIRPSPALGSANVGIF